MFIDGAAHSSVPAGYRVDFLESSHSISVDEFREFLIALHPDPKTAVCTLFPRYL